MRDVSQLAHGSKLALQRFLVVVHDDDALTRVAARSPEEITLVPADGRRQPVARAEEIDGAGLTVILSKDSTGITALGCIDPSGDSVIGSNTS